MHRWAAVLLSILIVPSLATASPRAYELAEVAPALAATSASIDLRRGGSNYFVFNLCDLRDACTGGSTRELGWIKFRLDLEYDVLRREHTPERGDWYVTFPFRVISFWDNFSLGSGARSAPFVEADYAAGLELTWAATPEVISWSRRFRPLFTLGLRHESNGLGLVAGVDQRAFSRSWNVVYGALTVLAQLSREVSLYSRLESWVPAWSEPVVAWGKHKLEDYVGYVSLRSELRLSFSRLKKFTVVAEARQHSLQLEMRWNIKQERILIAEEPAQTPSAEDNFFRLDIVGLCFFGLAERLTTANEARYSCYAGLGF